MEFLKNREEIAKALNFGKYPVIAFDVMDMTKQVRFDDDLVGFSNIKVRVPFKEYASKEKMSWYKDSKKFTFGRYGVCISSSFGYNDVMEDVEYANAPLIDKNTEFVLVINNSRTKKAVVMMLKTADYKRQFCQTTLEVDEEIDLFAIIKKLI